MRDAKKNIAFAPRNPETQTSGKPQQANLKVGMSKDSPFLTNFNKVHPGTKQLLDYGEARRKGLPKDMSSLSP